MNEGNRKSGVGVFYHRDTESTEVLEKDAKHLLMLLRGLCVLWVSVVRYLGTGLLLWTRSHPNFHCH